jgi:hypothetical protein
VILFPGDERIEPTGRAVLAVTRRERGSRWKSLASAFDINSAKLLHRAEQSTASSVAVGFGRAIQVHSKHKGYTPYVF